MLSVLIPIYNADVSNLVKQLHEQLIQTGLPFEIICIDDASTVHFEANNMLQLIKEIRYDTLTNNIGRAAIRNQLALKANFDTLLFIDSDMQVLNSNFIANYLKAIGGHDVVYGGIVYPSNISNKSHTLRWEYGRKKEAISAELRLKDNYLSIKTCNLLIRKNVFLDIQFNESIQQYGHEDTLFCIELEKNGSNVLHIDNPLLHAGLEDADTYLQKVKMACKSLHFIAHSLLSKQERNKIRLIYFYEKLDKMGLLVLMNIIYTMLEGKINKNLTSTKPSMLLLDYYKLICYHKLNNNLSNTFVYFQ